jgi:hypothetical protein
VHSAQDHNGDANVSETHSHTDPQHGTPAGEHDHAGHDHAGHDHGGGTDAGQKPAPDPIAYSAKLGGSKASELLTATDLGRVTFTALNNSGVTGYAELARSGDSLTVRIAADGLDPNQAHIQHIHGRIAEDGTAVDSNTPGAASDVDGDGFVELAEGLPQYGPILLNLSTPQGAGLDGFPTAPDGKIRYEQTFDLTSMAGFGMGIDAANLFPLDLREMVIHGLTVDGSAGAGTPGEIDGTAGYKLVLPVASGEIIAVGSKLSGKGGDDTLVGSRGDDTLLGGAGDDEVWGGQGSDQLNGGRGNDRMFGEAGFDLLEGGKGDDTLFGGTENDFVFGDDGDDHLHGDSGNSTGRGIDLGADQLNGGAGGDVLHAGNGLDVLTGGSGHDTFEPAFAALTDFSAAEDTLAFDVAGLGIDAEGANFVDGGGGVDGGATLSFFSGAAAASAGERVMVLTDQAFASGALAVQAAQGEDAGDFVIYFNSTVQVASLLVVSAPDTAASIARFTDITSLDQLQTAGLSASDFIFV